MVLMKVIAVALVATVVVGGLVSCAATPAGRAERAGGAGVKAMRYSSATGPLRIGVVGMSHGHVEGLLWAATQRKDVVIVGIFEPDRALFDRLAAKYTIDAKLYHSSLETMLDQTKPEAVSVMTPISEHLAAVEACAPRGVHLLLEKPLAFSLDDARRCAELSKEHGVLVLTNYETSWYESVREAARMIKAGERGALRKMVFRHGHKGPRELGCSEEFLAWLTDPEKNGGGAIVDFGCYGAVLSAYLAGGERPVGVVASAATLKPTVYPRVDDDATIVVTYPSSTAVIQASWAWTHDNKEMDLYTDGGSIHAGKWKDLSVREENGPTKAVKVPEKPAHLADEWTYLREVVRNRCEVDPLSGLELNLIAVEILDRARAEVRAARNASGVEKNKPAVREHRGFRGSEGEVVGR